VGHGRRRASSSGKFGLSARRARKAHAVLSQVLGSAVEGGRQSRNVAAGIKLPKVQRNRPVVEAAPEVDGHLHWSGVKTHEARTVRLPRSISVELGGYLASRPRDPDALVFTAPLGAPLRWSKWGKAFFKPPFARPGCPRRCDCMTCGTPARRC
jgi:hypothetical protein